MHNLDNDKQIEKLFKLNNFDAINIKKFNNIIRGDFNLGFSLLTLFKKQFFDYLNNLDNVLNNAYNDSDFIFQTIHAIKGASSSIAADKIVSLSKNIEQKIINNVTLTKDDFKKINQEMTQLLEYITALEIKQKI